MKYPVPVPYILVQEETNLTFQDEQKFLNNVGKIY